MRKVWLLLLPSLVSPDIEMMPEAGSQVAAHHPRRCTRGVRDPRIQARAAPVTEKQFEAIINRAAVPILAKLQDLPLELLAGLVPSLVRVMLAAAVEVRAEERRGRTR